MNLTIKNRIFCAIFLGLLYFLTSQTLFSLLEDSNVNNLYVSIAIVIFLIVFSIILSYIFLPNHIEKEKIALNTTNFITHSAVFNKINRTLMSSVLSLENKLEKVAEITNEHYKFGTIVISLEKNGDLDIVNFDKNIEQILKSKKLFSLNNNEHNEKRTILSKIIANQYTEQVGFSISRIETPIDNINIWGLVNIALISKKSSKLIGLITILLKNREIFDKNTEQDMKILADDLSFFVCFEKQKKLMLVEYERNKKDLEFAHDLRFHIVKHSTINSLLNMETKRSRRYGSKFSIIIFKIDNLANIKNTFSEEIALNIKKELVQSVQKNIRELDVLGVWSDDRFIILAPETDNDGAYNFSVKLENDIKSTRFKEVNKVTCSFGIAWFLKGTNDSELELVKRAESALEQAAKLGGNRIISM